jgi:carbamoylphosphate synthase small subunit
MEIISIEARTYEAMISRFQATTQKVTALRKRSESKKLKEWLDSQDVCEILGVTKRTVQTLRETGKLAYTMIAHKVYYRPEDVKKFLDASVTRKEVRNGK